MGEDVFRQSRVPSLSADQPIQAPVKPVPPTRNVPPKAIYIALSLVKPAGTLAKTAQALPGWPKLTAGVELKAEKIKTVGGLANESFGAVQAQAEGSEHGVELGDGVSQVPAGPGQENDVVHEAHGADEFVARLKPFHRAVAGREVEATEQGREAAARHHALAGVGDVGEAQVVGDDRLAVCVRAGIAEER